MKLNQPLSKYYSDVLVDNILRPSLIREFCLKPVKYYFKPILSFKIPYLGIKDCEKCGEKGLFIKWYTIEFGKQKVKNEKYVEEMKEYKKRKNTIYFINEKNFNIINSK